MHLINPLSLRSIVKITKNLPFNPSNASPTKWSNTLKQFVGKLPKNCLGLFDHFVGLALKRLKDLENFPDIVSNVNFPHNPFSVVCILPSYFGKVGFGPNIEQNQIHHYRHYAVRGQIQRTNRVKSIDFNRVIAFKPIN